MNAGALHRLARLLREIAVAATADAGERVSAGDLAIVEDVGHHDGTSVGAIADRTGLAQSLVSTTVAAMRDAGVFETSADPADRRRVRIRIAPAARTEVFKARAARPIDAAIKERLPHTTPEQADRINGLLDELATLLREERRG